MALPLIVAFTIIMTLILVWTKTLLPRHDISGELAEDRKDITTYKVRPSTHALFAEISYTASFIVITVWFRGYVYMIFTIPFIIVGGLCLLTHFARVSVFVEQIRSHGINPKIFSFKDIDRVEIMRKPGYRKILVFLKNNSYSARADLKLKTTDENIDLFMAKVKESDIPVKEELLAEKAGKEKKVRRFNRILLPRFAKTKFEKGEIS